MSGLDDNETTSNNDDLPWDTAYPNKTYVSDSPQSETGVLFVKLNQTSVVENKYWITNDVLLLDFVRDLKSNGFEIFVYIPYSSKEKWWKEYPAAPLRQDIQRNTSDSEDDWESVTPNSALIDYVTEEERLYLTSVSVHSMKYFIMSEVTANDRTEFANANNNNHKLQYFEGMPCFECTCCNSKLYYESPTSAKVVISGTGSGKTMTMTGHLLDKCTKFEQKYPNEYAALKHKKSNRKSDASRMKKYTGSAADVQAKVVIRLCRMDIGNVVIYNHDAMIARAKEVNEIALSKGLKKKDGENHVPVWEIYNDPKMRQLIETILLSMLTKDKDWEFEDLQKIFKDMVGVDIKDFREEWDTNNFETRGKFLKTCFIYTMRSKQIACAKCDKPFEGKLGGDMESNHVVADGAEKGSAEAATKWSKLTVDKAGYSFEVIVEEFCETQGECTRCHNKFGENRPYWDLDETCHGNDYVQLNDVYVFSDVQATEECKQLHKVIDGLVLDTGVSYKELKTRLDFLRFNLLDISFFRENDWEENISRTQRVIWVKQVEYYYEKRSVGVCFLCDKSYMNDALRDFCVLDGHHCDPDGKDHNPSDSPLLGLEDGRLERRKCIPLCRPCHRDVHVFQSKSDLLDETIRVRGYKMDEDSVVAYGGK